MDLLEQYSLWPELLLEGFETGRSLPLEEREVVICGLGGSGAAGDFLSAVASAHRLDLSVRVHKGFGLPLWARGKPVFALSYSGETLETLSCFREALASGSRVVAVSSGGALQEEARRGGTPWLGVRKGLLPRAALPSMLGILLGSTASGYISEDDLLAAYNSMRTFMADEAEPFAELAAEVDVLVVGACGELGVIAERWRQEFSENAKVLVKSEVYPESAHNDIVAWQAGRAAKVGFVAVKGEGVCREVMELVKEKYSLHGKVLELELGRATLASLLKGAQVGGVASVLAAKRRRTAPEATPFISDYKQRLKRALSA
ncbi:MAG: hypothetical protein NZ902_00485 [Acidilobaceae archaeon]|nr:hypothetical protein [Acidilobaceae archaeon]MCX8165312.1 hypothetical protein [Acidilobaceae archaeon]MDW7973738.1 SIS domain-containing protein [Sulfolobales archaeon]